MSHYRWEIQMYDASRAGLDYKINAVAENVDGASMCGIVAGCQLMDKREDVIIKSLVRKERILVMGGCLLDEPTEQSGEAS